MSPLLCLCHQLFLAAAVPCHSGCWENQGAGNWEPGCWEPLKGFGSYFYEPGSNSNAVKLTNKLAPV